ncbi:MAG: hypothetical protein ACOX5X_04635 [Acholeplasmataceae bacterium]|jgi:hypothetical protein
MKNRKLLGSLAFVGTIIFGLVWFITSLFGAIGLDLGYVVNTVFNWLRAVAILLLVLVVVVVGWEGASGKKLGWQIAFVIFALLSVAGAVLAVFF